MEHDHRHLHDLPCDVEPHVHRDGGEHGQVEHGGGVGGGEMKHFLDQGQSNRGLLGLEKKLLKIYVVKFL